MRTVRVAVLLVALVAMVGGSARETAAARNPDLCDSEVWVQAESILTPTDGPLTGISAVIGPLEPGTQLLPCVPAERDGFSAAWINLAPYDRHYGIGGDIVQLGIVQGSWAAPLVFALTRNLGIMPLPAPYPEAGRTYTLSIRAIDHEWHMRISEGDRILHEVSEPATWTDAASAWLMFEALSGGSLVGAGREADALYFSDVRTGQAEQMVAMTAPPCSVRDITRDADEWVIAPHAGDVRCVSADGFTAFHSTEP